MRLAIAVAGLLVMSAIPATAQQKYEPYSEWPHNAFGPSAAYAGGRGDMSFDTVQFFEGACAIGSIISFAVPAAGYACIPSQLMGLGQMFQPQQRPRQYAEAPPRRRVRNSGPPPARYASRDVRESEEARFERLFNAHLEKNNLMVVPRVERIPVPAPKVEAPKPVLKELVKAAKVQRAVFTRSAILRGDLVPEYAGATRLAASEPPVPPGGDIDTRLIRIAIAKMQ